MQVVRTFESRVCYYILSFRVNTLYRSAEVRLAKRIETLLEHFQSQLMRFPTGTQLLVFSW